MEINCHNLYFIYLKHVNTDADFWIISWPIMMQSVKIKNIPSLLYSNVDEYKRQLILLTITVLVLFLNKFALAKLSKGCQLSRLSTSSFSGIPKIWKKCQNWPKMWFFLFLQILGH